MFETRNIGEKIGLTLQIKFLWKQSYSPTVRIEEVLLQDT